jgi:riboflavin biosynthesis pyrimidine reductase
VRQLLPEPADALDDDELAEAYRLPPGRAVRVNFIASLDGATTVAGRSKGLQSPGDLRVFRLLRTLADAVLVGAGTAAAEGYRPSTVPIAVVSRRASLAPGDRLAVPGTLLVTCEAADPDRRAAVAAAGVDVLVCGQDDVDLPLALDRLAERGIEQVTCEGGPQLLRTALTAGVVDEVDLSIAPALVGGGVRLVGDAPLVDVTALELRSLLEEDGMLFARYGVRRDGGQVPGAR